MDNTRLILAILGAIVAATIPLEVTTAIPPGLEHLHIPFFASIIVNGIQAFMILYQGNSIKKLTNRLRP